MNCFWNWLPFLCIKIALQILCIDKQNTQTGFPFWALTQATPPSSWFCRIWSPRQQGSNENWQTASLPKVQNLDFFCALGTPFEALPYFFLNRTPPPLGRFQNIWSRFLCQYIHSWDRVTDADPDLYFEKVGSGSVNIRIPNLSLIELFFQCLLLDQRYNNAS